jgi:hypothetical protein
MHCYNTLGNEIYILGQGFLANRAIKGIFRGQDVFSFNNILIPHDLSQLSLAELEYTVSYYYESKNGCISDLFATVHITRCQTLFSLQITITTIGNNSFGGKHTSTYYLFVERGYPAIIIHLSGTYWSSNCYYILLYRCQCLFQSIN